MATVGDVVKSARSGPQGRRWLVREIVRGRARLDPLGDDVSAARSSVTGRWQGGVRSITVEESALADPARWVRA